MRGPSRLQAAVAELSRQGLADAEIAARLGCARDTVRGTRSRARKAGDWSPLRSTRRLGVELSGMENDALDAEARRRGVTRDALVTLFVRDALARLAPPTAAEQLILPPGGEPDGALASRPSSSVDRAPVLADARPIVSTPGVR